MTPARAIGPLLPWVCSYTGHDGNRYGIILYAVNEESIHPQKLKEFCVDGLLIGTI